MQTLSEYIAEKNAATRAWVAAVDGRWATTLCEDLEHWAKSGVHTAEDLEKYLLACDVYESTKSLHGYKPSWAGLMGQTVEQLRASSDSLARECNEMQDYWAEQERLEIEFEARERREQAEAEEKARTREEWTLGMVFAKAGL